MTKEETEAKIKLLRIEAGRCFSQANKEWPHHAEHSRRVGRELLNEAYELEGSLMSEREGALQAPGAAS
jgi:hypothetical protein